jgi:hypothetical protein
MSHRQRTWFWTLALGVLALVGYSILREPGSHASPRAVTASTASTEFHRLGRCLRAQVFLGDRPGAIDFVVWCRGGRPKEEVGFVLGREILPNPGVQTGILGFRHKMVIGGTGPHRRFGFCKRYRGDLACDALVPGRVRFNGRMFVNPVHRCQWGVGIRTTLPSPNEENGWSGPQITKVLASGLPRGC